MRQRDSYVERPRRKQETEWSGIHCYGSICEECWLLELGAWRLFPTFVPHDKPLPDVFICPTQKGSAMFSRPRSCKTALSQHLGDHRCTLKQRWGMRTGRRWVRRTPLTFLHPLSPPSQFTCSSVHSFSNLVHKRGTVGKVLPPWSFIVRRKDG